MAKKTRSKKLFMSPLPDDAVDATPDAVTPADDDTQAPTNPDVLPLPKTGPNSYKEWMARIKKAQKNIEDLQPEWDANVRRYLNKKRSSQNDEELLVPTLYTRVEQKKSQLIAQNPYVVVRPKRPDSAPVAPLMEAVMNDVLGAPKPDGVDAMAMFEEVMSDALCASGIFAVHIGYEPTIDGVKDVQTGEQPDPSWVPPDPATLAPGMPPPTPPMVPVMETVPNVVHEEYYMDRISPSKLLLPDDFRSSSDYDRAAWKGFEFVMDYYLAKRRWNLPDDFDTFVSDDDHLMNADDEHRHSQNGDKRKMVRGFQIYYKAAIFDKTVVHPYKQRSLVFIDGMKMPAHHKDAYYQWQNEDGTLGGMVGFPIHVGALRYVSDRQIPPSDATMAQYQDEEISDGRSVMKMQRKRNIPMRIADSSKLGEGGLAKIEKGIWQAVIPLDGQAFADGNLPIRDVQTSAFPQENFTFDNLANRDLDATWGLGAAPTGTIPQGTTSTSATQASAAQASSNSRIGRERNKFTLWYARAVEKLSVLYQHFMTDTQYVQMVGPDGAKMLVEWNKDAIAGKFSFSILPNSSIDLAEQRAEEMGWYNLAANSPNVNRRELDTELVKSFGKDPAKLIVPEQPPPPPPPALPHGISLNLDEKGLNPLAPAFPLIIALLRAAGVAIPDDAVAQAQQQAQKTGLPTAAAGSVVDGQAPPPPPPSPMPPPSSVGGPPQASGSAEKADVVDAHQFDRSGALPGPKGS